LIHPRTKVIWTAHLLPTAREAFQSMLGITAREEIKKYMLRPSLGVGQEAIKFKNGSKVLFGSRMRGFGRGFSGVTIIVFDECQILSYSTLEDTLPAMNRAVNPFYILMGTPPKPGDLCEVFTDKRKAAISGETTGMFYIECSADQDADPDDREQLKKANPSYPEDTPESAINRMRKSLPLPSFRREALGIWDERIDLKPTLINPLDWEELTSKAPEEGMTTYGIKFSVSGEWVGLAAALRPSEGPIFVEVLEVKPAAQSLAWLVTWLSERAERTSMIAVDGKAGTQLLVGALKAGGISSKIAHIVSVDDAIAAHALFLDAIAGKRITHAGQPGLSNDIAHAGRRPIGTRGGWGFSPINEHPHLTGLDATVLAHWAAATVKPKKPTRRAVFA
jgi:hypothetical protein